ncbi:MAG TPA: poly-gamma-glutamate system protein [Gemmatimonadales bacterium]|nr:poly-gamma-glutamate system protein [Gemmatimonadales bacterium]
MMGLRRYEPARERWHPRRKWLFAGAALLVAAFYIAVPTAWLALEHPRGAPPEIRARAVDTMTRGLAVAAEERARRGIAIDRRADPAGSGLIGVEFSLLTTTLGTLSSKQTSVDPAWAGVVADLLWQAGVRPGALVASGMSGSFPGLNLAVAAAADAIGAGLVTVASLGASSWGANQPEWTWAEIEAALLEAGVVRPQPRAYMPGGEGDTGSGFPPGGREAVLAAIGRSGVDRLDASDLPSAVDARLRFYDAHAARLGRPIAAYVNVGGSEASLGRCPRVLNAAPGLITPAAMPACGMDPGIVDGVMQHMAGRGIPVIHLLNLKELALRFDVPLR